MKVVLFQKCFQKFTQINCQDFFREFPDLMASGSFLENKLHHSTEYTLFKELLKTANIIMIALKTISLVYRLYCELFTIFVCE